MNAMSAVIAREYGYLDAKTGMGYYPRPPGHENDYRDGYNELFNPRQATVPAGTYANKTNWGWY